jgi:N-acetylglucosaminyldiphosphoundecaprenol N-acetyl-beta-D-mannosaminyltransferase
MIINKIYTQANKNTLLTSNEISTFVNPYSYLLLRKYKRLDDINNIYIDGFLLIWVFRLFNLKVKRKSFDMTSLAPKVFDECIVMNKKIYFIGSKENEINDFISIIKNNFTKLDIVGIRNGYFKDSGERNLELQKIIFTAPDIVICGMGTPYQEDFLVDLKKNGWDGCGYTCGGFMHQTGGKLDYYPNFYNKFNLRWLYRIIDEPKLISRYIIIYPRGIIIFIYDFVKNSKNNKL